MHGWGAMVEEVLAIWVVLSVVLSLVLGHWMGKADGADLQLARVDDTPEFEAIAS